MQDPAVVIVMTVPPPEAGEHAIHVVFPRSCSVKKFEAFHSEYRKTATAVLENGALLWKVPVSKKMSACDRKVLADLLVERIKTVFGSDVRILTRNVPMLA